jgi:hypothetical protein
MAEEKNEARPNGQGENVLWQKLDENGRKIEAMKSRVEAKETVIGDDVRELEQLIRDLKVQIGQSAFDKNAYQREYMRRKRATHPEYGALVRAVREDVPDHLRSKFEKP